MKPKKSDYNKINYVDMSQNL